MRISLNRHFSDQPCQRWLQPLCKVKQNEYLPQTFSFFSELKHLSLSKVSVAGTHRRNPIHCVSSFGSYFFFGDREGVLFFRNFIATSKSEVGLVIGMLKWYGGCISKNITAVVWRLVLKSLLDHQCLQIRFFQNCRFHWKNSEAVIPPPSCVRLQTTWTLIRLYRIFLFLFCRQNPRFRSKRN